MTLTATGNKLKDIKISEFYNEIENRNSICKNEGKNKRQEEKFLRHQIVFYK